MDYSKLTRPLWGVLGVLVLGLATQALCDLVAHWIWGDGKQITDTTGFFSICLLLAVWVYGMVKDQEASMKASRLINLITTAVRKAGHKEPWFDTDAYIKQDLRDCAESAHWWSKLLVSLDQEGLKAVEREWQDLVPVYDPTKPKELNQARRVAKRRINKQLRSRINHFNSRYDLYQGCSGPLRLQKFAPRNWKAHLPPEEPVKQGA